MSKLRTYCFLLVLVFFSTTISAQFGALKKTPLSFLKDQSRINVVFDYSEASINGLDLEEWIDYIEHRDDNHYSSDAEYNAHYQRNSQDTTIHYDADLRLNSHHLHGDETWKNIQREWKGKCINEANEQLRRTNMFLGTFPKAQYSLIVHVEVLDKQGYIIASVDVVDTASMKKYAIISVKAPGGRFGSLVNLMGDGHEHLGEELGKTLRQKVY